MIDDDAKIPAGFEILVETPDELRIAYRSVGRGFGLLFAMVCPAFVGGGMAYVIVTDPAKFRDLIAESWLWALCMAGCFWALANFVLFDLFHLFGETVIAVTADELVVSWRLFGVTWTKPVSRAEISRLEQVKDGGERRDSFPSWGLHLVGRRRCRLISKQAIEKSDWLGERLAAVLGVEFRWSEKR